MKLISYTLTALFATMALSIAAPDKSALEAKEKAVWQAFQDKKPAEVKKMLSPKAMAVYASGFNTLSDELADMAKMEMKSFTISDFKVKMTDSDTAIAT